MKLTREERRHFDEKGFHVARGLFAGEEARRLSDWLDALRTREPEGIGKEEEAFYYELSPITGENVMVRVENILVERNRAMRELMLAPKTMDILEGLLGEPAVLFKEKINYKLPGCRADKLHQDQAAGWARYADFFVTMCIAVDPNTVENAAMSVLQSGNYEKKLMGPEWQPLSEEDPPWEPAGEYLVFEAEPGDALFFDCYLPHGSPPNDSERSRRNILLTFNRASAGDMRSQYYEDKWASYPPNRPDTDRTAADYRV